MSQPPDFLPEERPPRKAKDDYYEAYGDRRGAAGMLWFVIVLLLIVMGAVGALAFTQPELILAILPNNPLQTQTADWEAVQRTQQALIETANALNQIGGDLNLTQQANDQQGIRLAETQAALVNYEAILNQTETQSVLNVVATRTAIAVLNAQQATRVALDHAATQSALNQQATQVELNYLATVAALEQAAQPSP